MSLADFWKDLYDDAFKREMAIREQLHQSRMQLIRCEGQRFSMLFALELAQEFLKNANPEYSAHLRNMISQWKEKYEGEQLEKKLGEVVSLAPAVQRHQRSPSSPQAETRVGVQENPVEWEGMSFPKRQ